MIIQDRLLLNIALSITMLGLSSLSIISYFQKIPHYELNEITSDLIGERIEISGTIISSKNTNHSTTLRVQNLCYTDTYIDKNLNLTTNTTVHIVGIVEEFNGKISLRAESIEK